ncbi:MAG: Hsp20/alpha crystallin family protein [Candidatus Woesearchaeota archaeon]
MYFDDLFEEIYQMQKEFDRLFNRLYQLEGPKALPAGKSNGNELATFFRRPTTDITETDKSVNVRFELPGVKKEDIQLNVGPKDIEVKVEKKVEKKEERKGTYLYESRSQSFYRHIPLPKEVIPDKADAKFENGVLEVEIPKAHPELSEKKKIAIK